MKFGYAIIYVADVNETLAFYKTAFGFEQKFVTDEGDYGELLTGETTLAFANLDMAKSNLPGGFFPNERDAKPAAVEIAFVTDDVQTAFDRALKAGATELSSTVAKPWGQTVGYLRDINGSVIELCTPIG